MKPWQHPIFDENIHHLMALLISLSRGCGGVIYLLTDDIQPVRQEIFQIYKGRLHSLICKDTLPISIVQVSLSLNADRSWAAVLLKKSNNTLKYPKVETTKGILRSITFEIDMFWTDTCNTCFRPTQPGQQGIGGILGIPWPGNKKFHLDTSKQSWGYASSKGTRNAIHICNIARKCLRTER